jgi:tyrosine-protein kinase
MVARDGKAVGPVEIRRQLALARSLLPFLVASAVLAGVLAYLVASAQPRVYEARSVVLVGESLTGLNPDYDQLLVSQRLSTTYAAVAGTRPVLEKVIAAVGLQDSPDALSRRIQVDTSPDSSLMTIVARDGSPARAAAIANALAEELVNASPGLRGQEADFLRDIEADLSALREQIAAASADIARLSSLPVRTAEQEQQLDALQNKSASLRATFADLLGLSMSNASNLLTIVQPAVAPDQATAPRPLMTAILAAVAALIGACAIGFVLAYFDDTIKSSDDLRALLGLPTLGVITRMKPLRVDTEADRLEALRQPRSSVAESYRTLRTNVEFASIDEPIKTLLVTSASESEGKTVTAANLAIVFAQNGRRVLLVDADLRRPGVHELFAASNVNGLTSVLRGKVEEGAVSKPTPQENLSILTSGPLPPNPAELLGSHRMRDLVTQLEGSYDLVILDSSPIHNVTDAVVLSSFLDAALLVVGAKRGRRSLLLHAHEALARANANVIGSVLNGAGDPGNLGNPLYYGTAPVDRTAGAKVGSKPS